MPSRKTSAANTAIQSRESSSGQPVAKDRGRKRRAPHGTTAGLEQDKDLSARKQAEPRLREGESRFRNVFDHSILGICVAAMDGQFIDCNPAFCRMVGFRRDELLKRGFPSLVHPEDLQDNLALVRELERGAIPSFEIQNRYVRKDGEPIWVHKFVSVLESADAGAKHYVAFVTDITRQRKAEESLKASERRCRLLYESMHDAMATIDMTTGSILDCNAAFESLTGYTLKKLKSMTYLQLTPEKWHKLELEVIKPQVLTQGWSDVYEKEYCHRNGTVFPVELRAFLVRDDDGNPARSWAIVRDITERKRTEQQLARETRNLENRVREGSAALEERERRLQAIFATANEAIIVANERGIVESVNPASERIFGFKEEELVGENISRLMPPPHREAHNRYISDHLRTGIAKIIGIGTETQARRKNGEVFPIHLTVTEFVADGSRLFAGFIRDISARKQLERTLLEVSEREQRRIGRDLHDGLGQEITAMSILAGVLSDELKAEGSASIETLNRLQELLQTARADIRRIARGLRSVAADSGGLMASLELLVRGNSFPHGVRCSFECPEPVLIEDESMAINLFRIAQESLSNALKHAQAGSVVIHLGCQAGQVVLEVRDDGIGPDPSVWAANHHGIGLRTMKYRAEAINGTLHIRPAPGGGTIVECCAPVSLIRPPEATHQLLFTI